MLKKIMLLLALVLCVTTVATPAAAADRRTILFIPHDNRPVSFGQAADTVQKLNYELLAPPKELLGGRDEPGKPDELWTWLRANAKKADAVVLSSDSLLYGSLVASRKHQFSAAEIDRRADHFLRLRKENPRLKIYVFGSIMRTPCTGEASGSEEPSYYLQHGADIFQWTALTDKEETEGLTRAERLRLDRLKRSIPQEALDDWLGRREKNFQANLRLVDMVRKERFGYLALGRDDNAPYSQTHKESRMIEARSGDLGVSKFQTLTGIDEIGLVLLTRAINDLEWHIPFVAVQYGEGVGAKTVPTYSDEAIGSAIRSQLFAAGAIPVSTTKRADLVLMVNTNRDGATPEANDPINTTAPRENTQSFVRGIVKNLRAGYKVSVADIAFGNGADNALMDALSRRNMLTRLTSYGGWNTATNSAGYALAQGILATRMSEAAKNELLVVRYLDDWAYQANVRQTVSYDRFAMYGGRYDRLDRAKKNVIKCTRNKLRAFAGEHLEPFKIRRLQVDFPWNRMFEIDVDVAI